MLLCWTWCLLINPKIIITVSKKIWSSKTVFNTNHNNKCFNQQINIFEWCWSRVITVNSAVLNSSPRAPPLYIFCMSLLVNTPDSDNQLVRSALRAWTVFRLTCSLHSVHCSLLPEQGKAAEVYFTSEHSFMDLRCATSLRTDECDIIYVCKYIQFKFTSRTLQCTMNGIRSLRTGIMEEYRVMSTSQGTCVRIEQTSEVIRVTYEMCRAVGHEDWNWEPLR